MKIRTALHDHQFAAALAEFRALFPDEPWLAQIRGINQTLRAQPYLRKLLRREYRLHFTLAAFCAAPSLGLSLSTNPDHIEAVTFVAQVLDVYQQFDGDRRADFHGRVRDALQRHEGMRALQFELMMATHFARRAYDVDMPLARGASIYDLLVSKSGPESEVECKSVSEEKGKGVHMREAIEFFALVKEELGDLIARIDGGVIVRMALPGRLPGPVGSRRSLCDQLLRGLLNGRGLKTDECEITTRHFKLAGTPLADPEQNEQEALKFISGEFGHADRQTLFQFRRGRSVFVLLLENARARDRLESIFKVLKDAAKDQLSKTKPGILCAKLEGFSAADLRMLGAEIGPVSELRREADRFLNSESRRHVAGISFIAGSNDVIRTPNGGLSQDGASYSFSNETGIFGQVQAFQDMIEYLPSSPVA